ncbi:MAG: methylmalonyl-CoA epimerase [Halioglobus sp.]|jgi:methylmalonyl-CoA/ethylmalonyl-CoA epimerase|nr:methylmalonyl-CoA epimerase [marine gamma proteobacterium HTCC2148]MBT3410588.1 methylmalonyl-CoA epimerase [Halieaceae bacterium]MDG1387893.1 methylmalonyl-CoA epimerase [Halioglobus sp.]MBT6124452.1 methylmalonyl-CoA epimerase [Halieaceae bacterium]MBT7719434.1 methylmalonyl-CoA epimerase [Halieaceae bacterium]
MITALDHIAIAVPDLEKSIKRFMDDFGLTFDGTEDVIAAKTSTAFFPVPPTNIELVHPLNGDGPIAGYLEKKGGGLHHLCFRSDNIEEDVERLTAKGYQFLGDAPSPGAHGSKVIFIHPKSCDGVLIEINQPADSH